MGYPDYVIELIAKVVHQANAAFQEHLGDFTPVPWSELDDHTKQSAYNGVLTHLNNPHLTPRESHENWRTFKNKNGWVYGPEKDLEKKTHPNLVAYEELPEAQRAKDFLFKNIVLAFLESIQDCQNYAPGAARGVTGVDVPVDTTEHTVDTGEPTGDNSQEPQDTSVETASDSEKGSDDASTAEQTDSEADGEGEEFDEKEGLGI